MNSARKVKFTDPLGLGKNVTDPLNLGPGVTDPLGLDTGKGENIAAAPGPLPPPIAMPVPGQDDLANIASRRRSIQSQLARRGRLSTILSQGFYEPLGGT